MYVDLGHLSRGAVVELHIAGNAANVWLMDSSTYSRYKRGNSVRAIGGHTRETPVRLQTNHSGHWYAAADLGGYPGRLGLQARVLPGAAAPLRQKPNLPMDSPLVTFADELPEEAFEDREFDVFISHATEDKDQVVRPLAHALRLATLTPGMTSSSFGSGTACGERLTKASLVAASASWFYPRRSSRRIGRSTSSTA